MMRTSESGHWCQLTTLLPACPGRAALKRARRHRIAGRDLALLETVRKPPLALLGSAVGEGIGYDIALRLLLQAVVTDGGSGLQRLIDIAGIEEIVLLLRPVRPHAGETIGLQFDAHLQAVRLGAARRRLLLLHDARKNAELILHVMADLVGDDIGLGKLAGIAVRAA